MYGLPYCTIFFVMQGPTWMIYLFKLSLKPNWTFSLNKLKSSRCIQKVGKVLQFSHSLVEKSVPFQHVLGLIHISDWGAVESNGWAVLLPPPPQPLPLLATEAETGGVQMLGQELGALCKCPATMYDALQLWRPGSKFKGLKETVRRQYKASSLPVKHSLSKSNPNMEGSSERKASVNGLPSATKMLQRSSCTKSWHRARSVCSCDWLIFAAIDNCGKIAWHLGCH